MNTILAHSHNRSILMVTHRLVFMQAMDEIMVLDQGQVVARGSHAALMTSDNLYRRMWELQHEWLFNDISGQIEN